MKNKASNDMITAFGIVTDNQGQTWSLPNGEKNVRKVIFTMEDIMHFNSDE